MNDRFLYKGKIKGILTGHEELDWAVGNLIVEQRTGKHFIIDLLHSDENTRLCDVVIEVDPSTVCQCTAMQDKNSKIAYEHDIINTPVGIAKIVWICSPSPIDNHINVGFGVFFLDKTANDNYRHDLGYWISKSYVIGNIFDNTELIKA